MPPWADIAAMFAGLDVGHLVAGLVGGAISAQITHRRALWRDRRKEFNDIARPLHEALGKQIATLKLPAWQRDTVSVSADMLLTTCPAWRRKRIGAAVKKYNEACSLPRHAGYNTATGEVTEHSGARAAVLAATEELRKAVHPY